MMKKFLTLFMSCLLLLSTFSVANADDIYDYIWAEYTDTWRIADTYDNGYSTRGDSWHLFHVSYPATEAGETTGGSHSIAYGCEISGSISVPIKKIELQFGISLSAESSFTITHTSRPLAKGEYIKAYWRKYYNKNTILQVGFRTGIGSRIAENGQPEDEVLQLKDVACGTRTCEVWIALQPQIRLEYYAPETTQSVQSSQDVYTEIYTYIDGEYVLTDSYTRTIESTDEY